MTKTLSSQFISELFTYIDGDLIWKARPLSHFSTSSQHARWNRRYAHHKAGGPNFQRREYRHIISINNLRYYRSVIVWCIHNSEWPSITVDHINGNALDDRIENLRLATSAQQAANRKVTARNKTGLAGVICNPRPNTQKWRYRLERNGKVLYVGGFDTAEAAYSACMKAKAEIDGEFLCEDRSISSQETKHA